ncbi:DUF4465 domain-containing protein [Alistipes sp.]|uniref:DUF4465 domain-containing protein n=1 Tax=Alistipes sp. TaxID=1872444 RepID=UPI0025C1D963|nr:DUF4465 domain-containing protein [Alistipes sp.]
MKKLLLFVLAAFALAACSDEDGDSRVPATAVVLDCTEKDLTVGETLQLTATPTPANTTDKVVWSSDAKEFATVSESGLVTGVAVGVAKISATYGSISATCTVHVGAAAPEFEVISFETEEGMLDMAEMPVELRDVTIVGDFAGGDFSNVLCGKEYMIEEDFNGAFFDGLLFTTADKKIGFGSYFSDYKFNGNYDTWGGFVLSQNFSMKSSDGGSPDYKKDGFSAWTTTGANESATFAIAYDNGYGVYNYHTPKIKFTEPRKVAYLYLANATVAAQYTSSVKDYWFKVVVTGYRKDAEGGSVEQMLIEGENITADWVKVDCSSLGEVDELRFKVHSNDMSGIYLNCPSYFCIDDIALIPEK